jgi:hypothetical protein
MGGKDAFGHLFFSYLDLFSNNSLLDLKTSITLQK